MNDYGAYRKECGGDADEYQDFVVDTVLAMLKIPIAVYSSRRYQYQVGESANGIEIKFDRKLSETGNLYIETAEKAQPRNGNYAPSGIFRPDNTWLWIQGNRDVLFVVPKKILLLMHGVKKDGAPKFRRVEKSTSQGFLVPAKEMEKYALVLKPK